MKETTKLIERLTHEIIQDLNQATEEQIIEISEAIKNILEPRKSVKFKINYQIGSSSDIICEQSKININNPFLEILAGALKKLVKSEKSWGIQLCKRDYKDNYNRGFLSELEFDLLCALSENCYDEFDKFLVKHALGATDENIDFLEEFDCMLRSDNEYSFLVYKGFEII